MAHSVLWPRKNFFYAIGNTVPVCLTQDLAPEQAADILLLGCGDSRSILYTIYADLAANRRLDFTCCDIEPAILARNALLFTLLADGDVLNRIDKIWNIFFHFYLDAPSLNILRSQCRKLTDMATDIDTWRNGPYGSFLKFCTQRTLSELRRHWMLYEGTENLPPNEKRQLKNLFVTGTKSVLAKFGDGEIVSVGRSAGPLWHEAYKLGAEHFGHYWATGIASNDKIQVAAATFLNPTFAYSISGRGFNVHYGTDPVMAFHLAETFAPTEAASNSKTISMADLAESVKSQFRAWCSAFQARVASEDVIPSIVIRMFTGDALAFCHVLRHCAQSHSIQSGTYTSAWGGSQINLDGGDYDKTSTESHCAPISYDIIDTSNMTDHVGLLNILIACIPLLRKASSAVLHTNYLLPMDDTSFNRLEGRACADVATLALLLGVVPTSYVSDFTTQSNTHELQRFGSSSNMTFYEVVSWKMLPLMTDYDITQPLAYEPQQLGTLLFDVYLRMFSNERLPRLTRDALKKMSIIHYIRATFVTLLQLIRSRISTDWAQAMNHLVDLIGRDKTLLIGLNCYQDLMCQLHIRGVHSVDALVSMSRELRPGEGFFRQWNIVPPVICIVLRIPRTALKVIENMDPNEVGTPGLHCEVRGPGFHNMFSSIQFCFGDVMSSGLGMHKSLVMEEDLSHWNGSSSLIVSFHIPSWILNRDPSATKITLCVRGTPHTMMFLLPKLGAELCLFSASLMDGRHIFVVRERPSNGLELNSLSSLAPCPPDSSNNLDSGAISVRLDNSGCRASGFTGRTNITEAGKRTAWAGKADVTVKQVSPYEMLASFGRFDQRLPFPFPIDSSNHKVRIARKSFYIEMDVALATPRSLLGQSLSPYPVLMHKSWPNLWNIHYLNLSRLPRLDVSVRERLQFLQAHLMLTVSDRERTALSKVPAKDRDVIINVKQTIAAVLLHFSGLEKPQFCVFCLGNPDDGAVHTLIFVNDLRLDLPAHTVVADACVLPLTRALLGMTSIRDVLKILHAKMSMLELVTVSKEVKAWKQLLPVLAERCREWKHTENCEYITKGVPVSTEVDQSPLCSCGKGKAVPASFMKSEWRALAPLVTRIALGPLLAVSYLEKIGTEMGGEAAGSLAASGGVCEKCGGHGKPDLMKCSRCREVAYCSKACQTGDWKEHKIQCKKGGK